jgi:Mn-dependent DtxR family transcriptional regulator
MQEENMTENEQKTLAAMKDAGAPMRPGDIAQAAGLEKDVVSKAIKELKKQGLVHSPKRCFWAAAE